MFKTTFTLRLVMQACLAFWGCLCLGATSSSSELDRFLQQAEQHNPRLQAARYRVEQMLIRHRELLAFFDPAIYAAVGHSDNTRGIPGATTGPILTNDATEIQAGIETPLNPGFYLSTGVAERLLHDPEGYDDLAQTLFGIRIRIPLLRDRAFANYNLEQTLVMAEYHGAVAELLDISQSLRRDLILAYIDCYAASSNYAVTQEATARFQRLVTEAKELSRLKVIPEYQIFDAQMDLQVGRENEEKARNNLQLKLIRMGTIIGNNHTVILNEKPDILYKLADKIQVPDDFPLSVALENRGAYQRLQAEVDYARVQINQVNESMKDELDLQFGVSWQGESRHDPFGTRRHLTDHPVGADVAIVWRMPLEYTGSKARLARFDARISELKELLREKAVDIQAELLVANNNYKTALMRMNIVKSGLKASEKTVAAEQERFRLGEGSSSIVTDAQKELTELQQRLINAAADLLRARTNFLFATGYAPGNTPKNNTTTTKTPTEN